jgi:hypothetical protein
MIGCGINDDVRMAQSALSDDGCDHPAPGVTICAEEGGEYFALDDAAAHRYVLDEVLAPRIAKAQAAGADADLAGLKDLSDLIAARLDSMPAVAVSPDFPAHFAASPSITNHRVAANAAVSGPSTCLSTAIVEGRDGFGELFADEESGLGLASARSWDWGERNCFALAAASWCQYIRIRTKSSTDCVRPD